MVRNISANGLAKLATTMGSEPIFIIGVDWASTGTPILYADRDITEGTTFVSGKILEVGEVDNVVDITGSNSSQQITVTLDDTDGTIQALMNQNDPHKKPCTVYQYFAGLDLSDKFVIFEGQLTTPIQWNEGSRSVTFTVVSRLEAQEMGFSADQGQFPFVPKQVVGKAWPVIFGSPQDVKALQVTQAVVGTLLCGVDLIGGANLHNTAPLGGDPSGLGVSVSLMAAQASAYQVASGAWEGVDDERSENYQAIANHLYSQMGDAITGWENQQGCALLQRQAQIEFNGPACNPIHILGGEDFPQNTDIVLYIKGALFFGRMTNDYFQVSNAQVPVFMLTAAQRAYNAILGEACSASSSQPGGGGGGGQAQWYNITLPVPPRSGEAITGGAGDELGSNASANTITFEGYVYGGSPVSNPTTAQIAQQFWAEAGTQVTIAPTEVVAGLYNGLNLETFYYNPNAIYNHGAGITINGGQKITYIVSITPGTVLAVKAYKTLHDNWDDHSVGQRQLVVVPNSYYEVGTVTYGSMTATTVTTYQQLSTSIDLYGQNEGWGDDLYVTFQSSVGPNPVDILKYIVDNWTNGYGAVPNLTYDATSFNAVHAKLAAFPMNFPVLEQRPTIDVLKDIAFQARCALWIDEGVVYLKYLPEQPSSDDTITVSDLIHQSVVTDMTPTEDLVTKMFVTWRLSWADGNGETPDIIVLRNNIAQYGTQRASFDFYCYNQPDIILKCATFWLIRKSNTWKRIKFKTPLTKLNLETFDTVTLNLPTTWLANGEVLGVVRDASYDSVANEVSFEVEVPVRAGEMDYYTFYWPSALTVTDTFPTPADIASGRAGSGNWAQEITGELPVGYTGIIGAPGTGINYSGEWAANTQYVVNDAVLYNGGYYVALSTSYNVDPGNLQLWELITQINQTITGGTVFVGGPNVVFVGGADQGDRTPGDTGFQAQSVMNPASLKAIENTMRPYVDLKLKYLSSPYPAPPVPPLPDDGGIDQIDIATTQIVDSRNKNGPSGYLTSIIKKIGEDNALYLNAAASVSDGENDARFDFEYDEDGEIWGVGTVFLKDPEDTSTEDTDEEDSQTPTST